MGRSIAQWGDRGGALHNGEGIAPDQSHSLRHSFNADRQILGHVTRFDSLDADFLERFSKGTEGRVPVELRAMSQTSSPGKN